MKITLTNSMSANDILQYINENPNPNLEQLRDLAGRVDISKAANAESTLLYSGYVGETKAQTIATGIAGQHPELGVIDQTEADILFKNPTFQNTLRTAVENANPSVTNPIELENLYNNALFGTDRSMWSIASENLASKVSGDVAVVISPDANVNRIFAQNELPKLLDNLEVNTINGIDRAALREIFHDPNQGLNTAINRVTATGGSMLTTLKEGTHSGTKVYDTRGFMKAVGLKGSALPSGTTGIQKYATLFKDGGLYHDWWNTITPNLGNTAAMRGALGKLGTAGDVLGLAMAVTDAYATYQNGDVEGAADIMAKWGVGFGGGALGGAWAAAMTAQRLAPLFRLGTPGVIAGSVISLAAGIYGGIYGEEAFLEVYEIGDEIGLYVEQQVSGMLNDLKDTAFGKFLADALTFADPHLVTYDKLQYDFQLPGEFVLTKGTMPNDTFEIQIRQERWKHSPKVSVNTAVATILADQQLSVHLPPKGVTCSSDGNDNIVAPNANATLIYGGRDKGSVQFSLNGNTVFSGVDAFHNPSVGYYISNGTAPVSGKILWANVHGTPIGSAVNVSFVS